MEQSTYVAGTSMRWVSCKSRGMLVVARNPTSGVTLSRAAKVRLDFLDWHQKNGRNVSKTCRHFGISRPTFYRWEKRYDPKKLMALESKPSRPVRIRRRTWSHDEILAVQRMRERFPRWGKEKLQTRLQREGTEMAISRVGRILTSLVQRGLVLIPPRLLALTKRRFKRPYGVRKPKDYIPCQPGDLVQIDTKDVDFDGCAFKHFTVHDVISKCNVLTVTKTATAAMATTALEAAIERMPFTIRAIQVDGGSEFMAEFEATCEARGILLFVLPPRSPKLNGGVERAHRTHADEFYDLTDAEPTVADLSRKLRDWEDVYNTIRPHQALGQLTPSEWLTINYHTGGDV